LQSLLSQAFEEDTLILGVNYVEILSEALHEAIWDAIRVRGDGININKRTTAPLASYQRSFGGGNCLNDMNVRAIMNFHSNMRHFALKNMGANT
jgi:hypothetical protein